MECSLQFHGADGSNLLLDNQRAALEEVVRERTAQLRATIAELQKATHHMAARNI